MGAPAWLLIFGLVATVGAQDAVPGTTARQLNAEEVQVVVAALDRTALRETRRFVPRKSRESADVVVPDSTLAACIDGGRGFCIPETASANITRLLSETDGPLADRFMTRIATSVVVPQFASRVAVVPTSEVRGLFRPGAGWDAFRQQFGRAALVQFSAPAIAGDTAAVYVVFGCGGLCGKSWLVTLERRGAGFRVTKARLLTIS